MGNAVFRPIETHVPQSDEDKCVSGNSVTRKQQTNKEKRKRTNQRSVKSMWEKETKKRERYEQINGMWGDNPDEKDQEDIRITSTNINGLSSPAELSQYIIGCKQFESDINCFQEVNLDTRQAEVVQEMKKAIRDVDETRGSTFQVSSPPEHK